MEFGNVKGFEVVIRRFDFGAFNDGEADGEEDVLDFLRPVGSDDATDEACDTGERGRRVRERVRIGRRQIRWRAARFNLRFDVSAKFV
jgi:hypothetical protein